MSLPDEENEYAVYIKIVTVKTTRTGTHGKYQQ